MDLDNYLRLPYAITLRPDEEGDWIAQMRELKGCIAHGGTQAEALERLDDAKREWIKSALEHALPVPMPAPEESLPSGKWIQRVPKSLHNDLRQLARGEGTSLNHLVTRILSEYVGSARTAVSFRWLPVHMLGLTGTLMPAQGDSMTYSLLPLGSLVVRERAGNVGDLRRTLEAVR